MIPVAASVRARKKNQTVFGLMGKCVVSGCPNRMGNFNRSVLNRAPKRFFRFPTAPDRVKVWLAALRETDKDTLEQHFICEDHFLPEDIFKNGISSDAIPIMPPYLDGQRHLISPWSGDSLQEEEQWSNGGWDNEEEEGEEEAPRAAPEPPEQVWSPFLPVNSSLISVKTKHGDLFGYRYAPLVLQNPDRGPENPPEPNLKR
ncbi:hypothetical protein CHARACLAT_019704 [Characodon lateralis]|uniref:THAP domain-containing protein 1 n=1 Tax=Characodon lateralis TaxID=208331 RepID=A0ABU7F5E1_9TELE|nr:hypothetical protein [Characodon lateralis]